MLRLLPPVTRRTARRQPVTAAATPLTLEVDRSVSRRSGVPLWQQQAWSYFDQIGEVRYGARYYGGSLSRLRMFVGWRSSPGEPVVPVDEVTDRVDVAQVQVAGAMLNRLHGTDGSLSGLLSAFGTNLFVAGEGYLVGRTVDGVERWEFLSVEQVVWHDSRWKLRESLEATPDQFVTLDPDGDVVVRFWQPHPRFADQADSPMRSVLTVCEELLLLSASVRASAMSRVPAGILVLPDTALDGGPDQLDGSGVDGEAGADRTLQDIVDHFVTPIGDPASAAAVVPHILMMDPEDCDRVQWIEPSRSVDETAAAQRAELLVRLANGVDLPPEVLTGMSGTNHWSAWLIDEQSYRTHIAPAGQVFAAGLTEGLIRPALRAAGFDPDPRLVVGFDPADLVTHPDRKANARDGHAALVLSDSTLRRALGFGDEDAPDEDEYKRRMSLQQGALQLAPVAAGEQDSVTRAVAVPLPAPGSSSPVVERVAPSADEVSDVEAGPPEPVAAALVAAAPVVTLGAELMNIDRSLFERLDALADAAMGRALERAGARVRSRLSRDAEFRVLMVDVPNDEVVAEVGARGLTAAGVTEDELLEDEFETLADEFMLLTLLGRRRAADALQRRAEDELPEAQLRLFEDRLDADRQAGRASLVAGLTAAAAAMLLDPKSGVPRSGEALAGRRAPTSVIRDALQRAGGGASGSGRDGGRLFATGSTFEEMGLTLGFRKVAEKWVYGTALRNTFMPHLDLDGVEFRNDEDEVLQNTADYPATTHFFPGDHPGCMCMTEPLFEAVAEVDGVVLSETEDEVDGEGVDL